MNSRERRILHLALRDETEVRSESVGVGPIRQVVVVPADMKTLPEPIVPPRPRPEDATGRGPGGPREPFGRDRRNGPPGRGRDRLAAVHASGPRCARGRECAVSERVAGSEIHAFE